MKAPYLFDFERHVLSGGKWRGDTVAHVAAVSPQYLVWAYFKKVGGLDVVLPDWYVHALRRAADHIYDELYDWMDCAPGHEDAGDRD